MVQSQSIISHQHNVTWINQAESLQVESLQVSLSVQHLPHHTAYVHSLTETRSTQYNSFNLCTKGGHLLSITLLRGPIHSVPCVLGRTLWTEPVLQLLGVLISLLTVCVCMCVCIITVPQYGIPLMGMISKDRMWL